MGNRYTPTTLTNRQMETIGLCERKLRTILFDRCNMESPNEVERPIKLLKQIIVDLRALQIIVSDEKARVD